MKYTIEEMQKRLNKLIVESINILCSLYNEDELKDFEEVKNSLQQKCNTELKPQPVDEYIYNEFYNKYDPDSSPKAWEYYLKTYKNIFKESSDKESSELNDTYDTYKEPIKNPEDGDKTVSFWYEWYKSSSYIRIYGTFLYSKPNETLKLTTPKLLSGQNIGIGGDCCFNFNTDKFGKFININKQDDVRKILVLCSALHYSPINFALMPKNGGMNNISGDGRQGGLDRFDTFISALDLYFKNKENPIAIKLIAEFESSQNSLVPFLQWIDSFENYLKLFYPELLIDDRKEYNDKEKLLDRLIESGKKPIDEGYVLEYIELAIRFWEAKLNYYNKQNQLQKS